MFYGFNLGKLAKQTKPRKAFSQRTGLFDRELKDELKEEYHTNQKDTYNLKPTKSTRKHKRQSNYSGIWDRIIEIIIAILIVLLVFSILTRMEFLVSFF